MQEIAHFFWKGNLTNLEKAAINSFVRHNFKVYLWSYDNLELPGVISKDASELLPENYLDDLVIDTKFKITGKISIFADLLRLEILNKINGWWFDADCFCLKDQSKFKDLRKDLNFYLGSERNGVYSSGVIYAKDEMATHILKQAHKIIDNSVTCKWGDIGPRLMTSIVHEYGLEDKMAGRNMFYPIDYEELDLLLDPKFISKGLRQIKNSHILHVWDAILVNKFNLNKNNPPNGSLLEMMYTFKGFK